MGLVIFIGALGCARHTLVPHTIAGKTPAGFLCEDTAPAALRACAKPAWVVREVIRIKALMPDAGCRSIADIFNRRFALSRKMTVGKSFVAEMVRKHQYDIQVLRKKIKARKA